MLLELTVAALADVPAIDAQTVIALLIVAACAAWLVRSTVQFFKGANTESSCGSCRTCPSSNGDQDSALVSLDVSLHREPSPSMGANGGKARTTRSH